MDPKSFTRIIEASITELAELKHCPTGDAVLDGYTHVLATYNRADQAGLREWLAQLEATQNEGWDARAAIELSRLRLQILELRPEPAQIRKLEHLAAKNPSLWTAEIHFVCGLAATMLKDYALGQKFYAEAHPEFERIGALKKSVKAFNNKVAAESRLHPKKKLIADYQLVIRKAKKVKEFGMVGVALSNISREYQKIGAIEAALRYANQAIVYMKNDVDSLHYYLAVAHRCHLFLELGRTQEAEMDFQLCQMSDYGEVKGALRVLEILRGESADTQIPESMLTFIWQEKLAEIRARGVQDGTKKKKSDPKGDLEKLTPLENKLLGFLGSGPKDKFQLIDSLYGASAEFELLEDRLKNLLSRIRKKRPDLMIFENGKYRISDDVFLKLDPKKKAS